MPWIAGGASAKTRASLIFEKNAIARPAIAGAVEAAPLRSSNGLSWMKAMPMFCPAPPKPKPAEAKMPCTASFSFWV